MKLRIGQLRRLIHEELARVSERSTRRTGNKASWKPSSSGAWFGLGGGSGGGGGGGGYGGGYGSWWPDWVESWGHNNHDMSDLPGFMQHGGSTTADAVHNATMGQHGGDDDFGVDSGEGIDSGSDMGGDG